MFYVLSPVRPMSYNPLLLLLRYHTPMDGRPHKQIFKQRQIFCWASQGKSIPYTLGGHIDDGPYHETRQAASPLVSAP